MRTVEICENNCGGCLECLLAQASGQLENAHRAVDASKHIVRAAEDFVQNVNNHLIGGGGEMSMAADASFRELRNAINHHRQCEECGEVTDLGNSEMIHGRIICNECKENSHTLGDAAIGREWRKNSSLEKWFPFTAERLATLEKEKSDALKLKMEIAIKQTD